MNYTVWRKQVFSTLIGIDLEKFLTSDPPSMFVNNDTTKVNPEFNLWLYQDQIIFRVLLGNCSHALFPVVSRFKNQQLIIQQLFQELLVRRLLDQSHQ
ncbi:hypothetical protein HanRHA438_Chr10g0460181 [Helianthus annuus]|nr:hypothetical protein HanRHA438_Chr10g0460181 [Helianthus annuus]